MNPQPGLDSNRKILWQPSAEGISHSHIGRYMAWLKENRGLNFQRYDDLWQWSVTDLEGFWSSIWDYHNVIAHKPYSRVLASREMPGAVWFEGAELNFAENVLKRRDNSPALIYRSESRPLGEMSYAELYRQTAAVAAGLRRLGLTRGDRVVAYMPNIPETIVAFLAAASLGVIWSSCAPELGPHSVIDRFRQIEPKVLIAVDGYQYGGTSHDRMDVLGEICQNLPSLQHLVLVPNLNEHPPLDKLPHALRWEDLKVPTSELAFEPVPFDHPLWVVYSSGTTGLPKGIVHGHGGVLLEHLKNLSLHKDIHSGDRFFWFTSTSWIMWNILLGGLLLEAALVLYDGSPGYPNMDTLWRLADEARITHFGTSAPFLMACRKAGLQPGRQHDLSQLRSVGSTGAPLPAEGFKWVYEAVKADIILGSTSGGTDISSAFVGACPLLPVYSGEIQCRGLGVKALAYDDEGRPVVNSMGELVVTEPMPSMPLFFWNDPDGSRYRDAYFSTFPGVWRHGDWIEITDRGTCIIYGRSDSTLKRGGIRMGTSEFYRVLDEAPEVVDSLVIDTSGLGREGELLLFVVLRSGVELDPALLARINDRIRRELSPRHVPDEIFAVPDIPRTLNGKKMEVPVQKILTGSPPERAANLGSMANPESIRFFVEFTAARARKTISQ
ncbi:MAG: Acetoacetyl-CoA synthetase [Firmicutes bacterium]|nr:Acetoacetyl-CoA synthetase [Bacillota bacterium]